MLRPRRGCFDAGLLSVRREPVGYPSECCGFGAGDERQEKHRDAKWEAVEGR
jgi:hypothetical protein